MTSLPSRGVWIEIKIKAYKKEIDGCRSPRGECGLKSPWQSAPEYRKCRSPRGECGLKCKIRSLLLQVLRVAPLAGSVD